MQVVIGQMAASRVHLPKIDVEMSVLYRTVLNCQDRRDTSVSLYLG